MDKSFLTAKILFILGAVFCVFSLITFTTTKDTPRLTEASNTEDEEICDGDSEVIADPDGYFMGKWNLWEYIGDSVSSLID